MSSSFHTVTIAGTGLLGYHIVEAILNDGPLKVLRRKPERANEKTNTLAFKDAEIVYVDYDQNDDLVKALKGIDVLVSVISGKDIEAIQSRSEEHTSELQSQSNL